MGSFFTSVQALRVDEESVDRVVESIRVAAADEGMRLLSADADERVDTTVVVVADDRWIAVYDEATEGQDEKRLHSRACAVSFATEGHALSIYVHDSDILTLGLYDNGQRRDRYNSVPDYFDEGLSDARRRKVAGKAARWRSLLVDGHTHESLQAVFASDDTFAETTLEAVATAVGGSIERMGVGFRYLDTGSWAPHAIVLRMQRTEATAWQTAAEGPPVFDEYGASMFSAVPDLCVGDELRTGLTVVNTGGAGKGLQLTAWGTALEQELVQVERFELLVGSPMHNKHTFHEPAVERSGDPLWYVDLPDAEIPAGCVAASLPVMGVPVMSVPVMGTDAIEAMQAQSRSQLHINVVGKVRKAGTGTLITCIAPTVNAQDGGVAVGDELTSPARR